MTTRAKPLPSVPTICALAHAELVADSKRPLAERRYLEPRSAEDGARAVCVVLQRYGVRFETGLQHGPEVKPETRRRESAKLGQGSLL